MASKFYTKGLELFFDGTGDWDTDTDIKIMLLDGVTSTPDTVTHEFVDDIVADEFPDISGYAGGHAQSGRKTLSNKAFTAATANLGLDDTVDLTWTSLGGTATPPSVTGAAIFKEGTADTNSQLICYIDLADTVTNGGNFTIQWHADGIMKITPSTS